MDHARDKSKLRANIQSQLRTVSSEFEFEILEIQRYGWPSDDCVIIMHCIHSTDGCPQDTLTPVVLNTGDETITYNYTWPETDIGAPPVEPCPCISRRCGGSYGSSGSWEKVTGTCDASSYSSSTLDLCKAILVLYTTLL